MAEDKEKYSHLVIDLKRLSQEKAREGAIKIEAEPKKEKVSFLTRMEAFFTSKNKKEKGINFLDEESLYDEQEEEIAYASEEFDPESAESLAKAFEIDDKKKRKRKSKASFGFKDIFSLPYRTVWLVVFFVRFVWFFFARIASLLSRELRELTRPKFGKVDNYDQARFFARLFNFPKALIRGLGDILGSGADEEMFQERMLFKQAVKKEISPAKQALSFACLVLVLILPFKAFSYYQAIKVDNLKGKVMGAADEAVNELKTAGSSLSDKKMSSASLSFSRAGDNFRQARQQVEAIDDIVLKLAKFSPNKKDRLAAISKEVLELGELASDLGTNLSMAFDGFVDKEEDADLTDVVDRFLKYERKALDNSVRINEIISEIDMDVLPKQYKEMFIILKEKSSDLELVLTEISELTEQVRSFLGFEKDKRYLILFQNNNEMRATGGFIGSFAQANFSKGKIEDIKIPGGGSYDTEGGLLTQIASPKPLHLVDPMWHFWDANWWPDWEKSAKKLAWFYEKSGGPTVDGAIALTPTVLERILRITGPIDMSQEYGLIMNADNFWINIRDIIEKEKLEDQKVPSEVAENKPKKVVGAFFERLMEELPKHLNKESIISFLGVMERSLEEKHILFYFKDQELQEEVEKRGWGGKIKETSKDYLMVVNTNIAGGKSDRRMRQEIEHTAEIKPDGSIVNTLIIKRDHTGKKDEPYYGVRNVNWMRIYVPKGSKLLEAAGFRGPDPIYFEEPEEDWDQDPDVLAEETGMYIDKESQNTYVYEESGKTVFANWSMIDPGENREMYIRYELPFKFKEKEKDIEEKSRIKEVLNKIMKVEKKALYPYSIMIQKQPGDRNTTIDSNLKISDEFSAVWNYPQTIDMDDSGWQVRDELNDDKYWALIMERTPKIES